MSDQWSDILYYEFLACSFTIGTLILNMKQICKTKRKKIIIFNELLLISAYKYHKLCCVYGDIGTFFGTWSE